MSRSAAPELSLALRHKDAVGATAPVLAAGRVNTRWRNRFDLRIRSLDTTWEDKSQSLSWVIERPDGSNLTFTRDAAGTFTFPAWVKGKLVQHSLGLRFYDYNRAQIEEYRSTAEGFDLYQVIDLEGLKRTVTVQPNGSKIVTDDFGRSLEFASSGASYVMMGDPVLTIAGGENEQHIEADNSGRTYVFNSAQQLISILDEAGVAISSYGYAPEPDGRVVSSRNVTTSTDIQLVYNDSYNRVTETDLTKTGVTRQYDFTYAGGTKVLRSATQPAGAGCAASSSSMAFDSRANVVSRDDFNYKRHCLAYDPSRNVPVVQVQGLSNATSCPTVTPSGATLPTGARKVSTEWHPDWALPVRTAEPGRIKTFIYNGQPDPFNSNAPAECAPPSAKLPDDKPIVVLCRTVEQATTDSSGALGFGASLQADVQNRVQSWTYNGFGQVLTHDGPRTDVNDITTLVYYAEDGADHLRGDVAEMIKPSGHSVRYTRYNKHGPALEVLDENGVASTYVYDSRLRLTEFSVAGLSTTITYHQTGNPARVSKSDGTHLEFDYDTNHRLISVSNQLGQRIEYTLDPSGNRVADRAKDSSGMLQREVTRVFDVLNRPQQISGRED